LIRLYGSRVLAVTLNTAKLSLAEARACQQQLEKEYGLPVILPLEDGMERLSGIVQEYVHNFPAFDHKP
jgi:uncharacterized NAD-dependent epimerase/dehydratase family protein